ncbi:hypothetical protein PNEG_02508 [Pneumocystis murina B123]|uniref:Uncharacterized protein n=1 Tax=Pneumocystis murina (strain B123) TaxID=1069680 RepID=M7NKJ8_PNEMU|nr:hypothetical protein PNEG_02508 [Pneumocystis murina B123]EMR09168.1 hypothetical protein PNEG_02508 [Pneumocystis murina B123]
MYEFMVKNEVCYEWLETFEISRKIWVILSVFDAKKEGWKEGIEREIKWIGKKYKSVSVIRFLVKNLPLEEKMDGIEVIGLSDKGEMEEKSWRDLVYNITYSLLKEFEIFARKIQEKMWIESPYVSKFGEKAEEMNEYEEKMEKIGGTLLKGRKIKILGDLYLLSGCTLDALKKYTESAMLAKASKDYIWHGSALEGIGVCLVVLSFLQIEYQIPITALPSSPPQLDKIGSTKMMTFKEIDLNVSKPHVLDFLLDLHMNIIDLYQKSYNCSNERVPTLCFSESVLRFGKLLSLVHLAGGWNHIALRSIIYDEFYLIPKTRVSGYPPKADIASWSMRAHSPYVNELDVVDKCRIYGGLASILGMVGFRRARAMFLREIISTLTPVLINSKVDWITDDSVRLIAQIALTNYSISPKHSNMQNSSFLIHNLLDDLCDCYGILRMDERCKSRSEVELLEKYGWPSLKITILKECISFCEALPDFSGVLNFTTKILSIASIYLSRDNQIRFASNIPRIILAVRSLGLDELEADYWDRDIVQSIEFIPGSSKFTPILYSGSELDSVDKDNNYPRDPFIYNPFIKKSNIPVKHLLVEGDVAEFKIVLHNPLSFELECVGISLFTEGVEFESQSTSVVIGPQRIHIVRLFGCPKEPGEFVVKGCRIHLSGCKDDIFLVNRGLSSVEHEKLFLNVFYEGKIKSMGLNVYSVIKSSIMSLKNGEIPLKNTLSSIPMTIEESFEVLPAQPILIVTRTSLVNGSIMLLEGERSTFTITIKNVSHITINFLLLSFTDSTINPLKDALASKNISREEIYELELFLYKRQAFVWNKKVSHFSLKPDCEEVLEIEIFGKRGLTDGKIQIDYGNVENDSSHGRFYTRRVVVPVIVTVNASLELVNCDVINIVNDIKERENIPDISEEMGSLFQYAGTHEHEGVEYCLGLLDFRNIWPKPLCVYLNVQNEGDELFKIEKLIYPGETNRLIFPLKRIYISREDSQKPIPIVSTRQFVVSNTKKDSEVDDYQQRESFWLREALFRIIDGTWVQPGADRKGVVELRGLRMTPKMVYSLKVEDISVVLEISGVVKKIQRLTWLVKLYEFVTFTLKIINRKEYPIKTLVRIQPSLRYQNQTLVDLSRCVTFNGIMQTVLPLIESQQSHEEKYTAVFMNRGEYEIMASIQELYGPDKGRMHVSRNHLIVKCVDDIEL